MKKNLVLLAVLLGFNAAAQDLKTTHYKYKVTAEVLEKIAKAKGDNRAVPLLQMPTTKKEIAVFHPGKSVNIIKIEEKVYDICASLGKDSLNALACVIGHELGHYYENHAGGFGYADKYSKDISVSQRLELEKQADKFGLFYGMLAGYDTYSILPVVLNRIYEKYGKGDKIAGYPSKEDRIAVARVALLNNQQWGSVYEAGQWLYAIKSYDFAEQCFSYLLNHFPSKEIHNNLGVVYLQKSLASHKVSNNFFAYPFEFDLRNRILKTADTAQVTSRSLGRSLLIAKAIKHFEEAIRLDEYYETAYINLAGAYSLDGNQESAAGKITELEKKLEVKKTTLPPNGHLIRGISRALAGNYASAKKDFEKAVTLKAFQAEYNKDVFAKVSGGGEASYIDTIVNWVYTTFGSEEIFSAAKPVLTFGSEAVNGMLPSSIKADNTYTSLNIGNRTELLYHRGSTYTSYQLKSPYQQISLLLTSKDYTGKSNEGISSGSKATDLYREYGNPGYKAAMYSGETVVYPKVKVAFLVSADKVTQWGSWQSSK